MQPIATLTVNPVIDKSTTVDQAVGDAKLSSIITPIAIDDLTREDFVDVLVFQTPLGSVGEITGPILRRP